MDEPSDWTFALNEYDANVSSVFISTNVPDIYTVSGHSSENDALADEVVLKVVKVKIESSTAEDIVCVGGTKSYTAVVDPPSVASEGTFSWSVNNPGKLGFADDDTTNQTITVTGLVHSAGLLDEELKVTFTAGDAVCEPTTNLTIFNVEMDVKPKGVGDYESLPDPIQIAAGGFASPVHQADVVIQVEPALAGIPISLGLLTGVGHERHAQLEAAGLTTVGGGAAIVVETGAGGVIEGVLTSSDSLDICTVYASLSGADCQEEQSVEFNWVWMDAFDPEADWLIEPAEITGTGIYTNRLRLRHHRAELEDAPVLPLDQHVVRFYVEKVVYLDDEGEEQVLTNTADIPSTNVNEWAVFVDATTTDAEGEATAYLDIKKIDGLVYLEFKAYDWSVYWDPPFDSESASSGLMTSEAISLSSALSDDRNKHTSLSSQGESFLTLPFIALAPKYVPVVDADYEMAPYYGGRLILCLARDTAEWTLRFSEPGESEGDWVVVDDSIIYSERNPDAVTELGNPFFYVGADTSNNRFVTYDIVARRKGRFRAEFLRNGVLARWHEFEAVAGHWNAVGESTPLEVDSHAVFPVHVSAQTPPNFKARYQLTGNPAGDYAITNHSVSLGAFVFESLPASSLDIWTNAEGEQDFKTVFKLASQYYIKGLTAGDLLSITNTYTRLGTTTPIRLIAADMKIVKPTGKTPAIGEAGASENTNDFPLLVFDQADNAGKCKVRCEAAPLAGLTDESKALVWSLLEWKLPDVGPIGPGNGVTNENVTTFTYNGMPTHTDDYGNTNITLSFKDRPTWAYHQPVQFRYNRTNTSAAAAALTAGTIGADYAAEGNPNWYVYWQQVANQFENTTAGEAGGVFGPQSTKMVYNSAYTNGNGAVGTYKPTEWNPSWQDLITIYDACKRDIHTYVRTLHHENGHRHSYQLPPEKGGFDTSLIYTSVSDSDGDFINDEWEKPGSAGYTLGFDLLPGSVSDNKDWRGNWDHGWITQDQVQNPPEDPYTNDDGYVSETGSGLTVRNQNQVDAQAEELKKKDWSSTYTPSSGE